MRGKYEAEHQSKAIESALATQAAEVARRDAERFEAELKDYKNRAQVCGESGLKWVRLRAGGRDGVCGSEGAGTGPREIKMQIKGH